MKLDDYFQRATTDAAFRAQQIDNSEYLSKFCLWTGGGIILVAMAYSAWRGLATGNLPSSSMMLPGVLMIGIYERERTKVAALRALDRQNPPM